MKKLLAIGLACVLVSSSSIMALASDQIPICHIGGCAVGDCFIDADGDGICGDHCFVDENGDGICDNHCYYDTNEDGICDYFVDDDNDGICDHCHDHGKPVVTTRTTTTRRSSGCHSSGHHGGHHGRHC